MSNKYKSSEEWFRQAEYDLSTAIKEVKKTLIELLRKKEISISKIVIFGSFSKEIEKEDSDIDIIVVSKDFRNKSIFERVELTAGVGRELVKRTKKPFDILYYSDKEWENSNSLIINAAKKEGITLYG